jgi:diguanylate cyclase (GGDEF)-like protein
MALFIFSFFILDAQTVINIKSDSVNLTDFKIDYYIDKSKKMSLQEVEQQHFTKGNNRLSLGIDSHMTWIKMILKNQSQIEKKLYIHSTYAYHASCTSFYEVDKEGKVLKEISFEPRKNINTEYMDGAIASFKVILKPDEQKTIYMKSSFLAYQIIEVKIFDNKHAKNNLIHEYMLIIILTSILLTLAGYYTMLFIASRHKEYLYYTLYLISSSIFIAYSYGMLSHYFYVYGKLSLYLNASILISPVFLAQFVKTIFNTADHHRMENRLLNSIIVVFILLYAYSFIDYYLAMELASPLYLYLLIVMMYVGIALYRKSVKLIKYFLVAHIFYIISTVISVMFYNELIVFNYVTSHAIALGTMIEAFLLAFLVSYRIRILEDENFAKDQIMLTDMMTTLYNKSYFDEALNSKLAEHREEKNILALIVIDIDFFKQYNDTYGHIVGDEALRSVSKMIKDVAKRKDDMAFRIGGEEFALICTDEKKQDILLCAYQLKERIENMQITHEKSEVSPYLTVSLGIYFASTHIREDAKKVFIYADEALYSAKKQGRNSVFVYGEILRTF